MYTYTLFSVRVRPLVVGFLLIYIYIVCLVRFWFGCTVSFWCLCVIRSLRITRTFASSFATLVATLAVASAACARRRR
ncbi:hypothetical protein DFP72DRAFT_361585 [Ephemerocybe angulata]|uniref:Uncharacterized protein n=1 Tax=Ephemerocybe angulata TaxID=980116 RepID=A0A8H6M4R3_9AGAR|nr:hypothetical protein DFP72DRAFT_361585 [Tulosesus angulatus]